MLSTLPTEDDSYFSEDTRVLIRSNKEYLLAFTSIKNFSDPSFVYAHRYDFHRILRFENEPASMRWIIAYLNGIENPSTDVSGMKFYYTIDKQIIDKLIARKNTVRS